MKARVRAKRLGAQPAMSSIFDRFTAACARFTGRPAMFVICILIAGFVVVALLSHDELLITRAHLAISVPTLEECSHCHEMKLPHHVCPNCGYYQGRLAVQPKPAADDAPAR